MHFGKMYFITYW